MGQTLAVRGRTSLEAVREAIEVFAERDLTGEVLTAIKHFPAREASFVDMPAWVRAELLRRTGRRGFRGFIRIRLRLLNRCGVGRTLWWLRLPLPGRLFVTTCRF